MELRESLPFATRREIGSRARLGCILLASDYTLEHEFREVLSDPALEGVALYNARIANSPDITPETLRAMQPALVETANRLLPGDTLDVLAYACTSASMVLGPDAVNDALKSAKPDAATTNPASAAIAALRALGARRLAVLTPYRRDVNQFIADGLTKAGFKIPVFGSFNEQSDTIVSMIDAASIESAARALLYDHDVDALFVSCTSIRMLPLIERFEHMFAMPVVSSNQALIWHCLRLANVRDALDKRGSLFSL